MTRGRPPKPVEIKRRTGNPGKRKLPEPISIVRASESPRSVPANLGVAGSALWDAVWSAGTDWLAPSDAPLVAILAELADERESWKDRAATDGPTFTTATGYVALHPAVSQVRTITRDMIAVLSLLGFSPTDRSRLGLAEVKRMSGLAELLERRRAGIGR
jgi:P27 family predicted phage terminase small subunit